MNKIYDNGALMLGTVKMVKDQIKKELAEDIDMCYVDAEELLKELEHDYEDTDIVCINYENPMGYTIDVWKEYD